MDPVIEKILTDMKAEYGITKYELEKIIDSQFKLILENMSSRSLKEVNLMYLGKIKPTFWYKQYHEKLHKEGKEYSRGLEELSIPNTGDGGDGSQESGGMCTVSTQRE